MTAPVDTGGPLAASTDAVAAVDRPLSATRQRRPIWESPVVWGLVLAVAGGLIGGWLWWSKSRLSGLTIDCRRAVEDKDWPRLERAATTWSRLQPRESRSWIYLAQAQGSTGRLDLAAASLDRVDERDPKGLAALFERVDLTLSGLNDPLEAERTCRRILAVQPDAGRAHQRLIYIYSMSLQRRKLIEAIREAIRQGCEPQESYPLLVTAYSFAFTSGYETLQHWVRVCPNDEAIVAADAIYESRHAHTGSAERAENPQQDAAPLGEVTAASERFPRNLELLAAKLLFFQGHEDVAGCERELQSLPEDLPADPRVLRAQGWVAQKRGEWELAEQRLQAALSAWPADWRTRFELSVVQRQLRKAAEAKQSASLAEAGKTLDRTLQQAPVPNQYSQETLREIAKYLADCGLTAEGAAAEKRLAEPNETGQITP